jgi:YidC/Oxa1 family membrane protein insertase
MDKTGIIVVSICVLLLGWWFVEQNKIAQQQARFNATNIVATAQSAMTNATATPPSAAVPATAPAIVFSPNLAEQILVLTNGRARYTFTSRGGGLKLVELLDYPQTISQRWKKTRATDDSLASLNTRAPLPMLAVGGDAKLSGDGIFTLTPIAGGVRAEKKLSDGLQLVKDFTFSSNFLVNASLRFENTSGRPLALPAQELIVGTATPMDADDTSLTEGLMWSDGKTARDQPITWFSGAGFGCMRGAPRNEFLAGSNNVVWAAAHNQFFTVLAMPKNPAAQVVGRPVTLPPFPNVEQNPNTPLPRGVEAALVFPAQTLTANSALERQIVLFAGPKEYRTLADIGAQFNNRADDVMGFGGWLGFCAKPLLIAMNSLHDVTTLGYGWVIVLITVLIKVVFWPLTAASTRSMKRMQALAPELKALQEKYKDDVQKLTKKQWELYKIHKVNPMSGCLPMLIQMPVFIGFFTMIRSAIELRGAHFLWVTDLSKPDTLFMIPGLDYPFNLLPLLMGGSMLWQSHLTPPSPGMDASQAKMMKYMPLIFLVFLYNYSAGLALYWTVNNLLTVLQTKLTRNLKDPAAVVAPGPATNPALTPASKKKK